MILHAWDFPKGPPPPPPPAVGNLFSDQMGSLYVAALLFTASGLLSDLFSLLFC